MFIPYFLSDTVAPFSKHPRNKQIFGPDPEISGDGPVVLTVEFLKPLCALQTSIQNKNFPCYCAKLSNLHNG